MDLLTIEEILVKARELLSKADKKSPRTAAELAALKERIKNESSNFRGRKAAPSEQNYVDQYGNSKEFKTYAEKQKELQDKENKVDPKARDLKSLIAEKQNAQKKDKKIAADNAMNSAIKKQAEDLKNMQQFNSENHKIAPDWIKVPEGMMLSHNFSMEPAHQNKDIKELNNQIQSIIDEKGQDPKNWSTADKEKINAMRKNYVNAIREHTDKRNKTKSLKIVPDHTHPLWDKMAKDRAILDDKQKDILDKKDKLQHHKTHAPEQIENFLDKNHIGRSDPKIKEALANLPQGYIPQKTIDALLSTYGSSDKDHIKQSIINTFNKYGKEYQDRKDLHKLAQHLGIAAPSEGMGVSAKPIKGGFNIAPTVTNKKDREALEIAHQNDKKQQASLLRQMVNTGLVSPLAEGETPDKTKHHFNIDGKMYAASPELHNLHNQTKNVSLDSSIKPTTDSKVPINNDTAPAPIPVAAPAAQVNTEPTADISIPEPAADISMPESTEKIKSSFKKSIDKDELIKALNDAGFYQSALDLKNWDHKDTNAIIIEKLIK